MKLSSFDKIIKHDEDISSLLEDCSYGRFLLGTRWGSQTLLGSLNDSEIFCAWSAKDLNYALKAWEASQGKAGRRIFSLWSYEASYPLLDLKIIPQNLKALGPQVPLFFGWCPRACLVYDHDLQKAWVEGWDKNSMKWWENLLRKPCKKKALPYLGPLISLEELENLASIKKPEYLSWIKKALKAIWLGETYQINLSHSLKLGKKPLKKLFPFWRKVSSTETFNFGGYLEAPGFVLLSFSPERLIHGTKGTLRTRPIAGTRPKGEISWPSKEISEHAMLVDLARNDLGSLCQLGQIQVEKAFETCDYKAISHLESSIVGIAKEHLTFEQIMKGIFPGGTITGVPKQSTMEWIHGIEPHQRGLYTGSLGYKKEETFDMNILIRSIVWDKNSEEGFLSLGGGITALSDPEKEYEETLRKGMALASFYKDEFP